VQQQQQDDANHAFGATVAAAIANLENQADGPHTVNLSSNNRSNDQVMDNVGNNILKIK
jgi:hypothetical protein